LEVNLKFVAQELERDLHFITELPLMSAIIQSQRSLDTPAAPGASGTPDAGVGRGAPDARGASAGQPAGRMAERDAALAELPPRALKPAGGGGGAVDLSNFAPQSPAQWLDRQGELFDGFLNANPGYLMMASCVRDDDDSFRELVRSERVAAGLRIHRVPRKQLLVTSSEVAQEESDLIEALRPGAVLLTTNDQISEDIPTNNRSPLVLTGISATYDGEGDFFGINVIESDLRDRLQNLLPAVTPEYINVCVTDSQGMIVMDYKADRFTEPAEAVFAGERFPQLGDLFRTGAVGGESGDGKTFYATIAQLGSRNSRARVGIIAYVVQPRVTP
jgi:hypothetical protein